MSSDYSTYSIPDLLKRWDRGELSAEQVCGHLLQHLFDLSNRLAQASQRLVEVEKRLHRLESPGSTPDVLVNPDRNK